MCSWITRRGVWGDFTCRPWRDYQDLREEEKPIRKSGVRGTRHLRDEVVARWYGSRRLAILGKVR
jgi:hypothetical protein